MKDKETAKEKEIVTIAARPGISPEPATTRRRVGAKRKDSGESVTNVESRVISQGNAPRREASRKEKEMVTKVRAMAGERASGR